jgi:polysaccharide export outer membrane protein
MRSREITLQRERATMESNISRYRSELSRLLVTIGELDIKINDTQNLYKRRVLGELDDLRRKLQEIDASMPSAREMRDVRSAQAANTAGVGQAAPPSFRLVVRRTVESELKALTASGETLLEPGDVVEVKRLRMESPGGTGNSAAGNPGISNPVAGVSAAPSGSEQPAPGQAQQRSSLAEGGTIGTERAR